MGCCYKKPKYEDIKEMGECFDVRQKRYDDYYKHNKTFSKVCDSDFYEISLESMN